MAISIESQRNDYTGDGATKIFPYVFKVITAQDLNVIITDINGNESTLLYPTDYAVDGIGQTNGGNVTLTVALTNLCHITIRRKRHLQQTTSFRNETDFYGATHEDGFDKLLMIDQQQQEEIDRRIRVKVTESTTFNKELPRLTGQIERVIGTNATGDGFELGPTFTEIENAQQAALDAEAAAASAQTSATSAATSATASAASATAAAASAASAAANGFDASGSPHAVTDGQAATNLTGETFNSAVYSSVLIFFEIIRGTTVMSVGWFQLNYLNGAWRLVEGPYGGEEHGVTWSLTGTTTAQLKAALDVGAGNGSIKFKKTYFAA